MGSSLAIAQTVLQQSAATAQEERRTRERQEQLRQQLEEEQKQRQREASEGVAAQAQEPIPTANAPLLAEEIPCFPIQRVVFAGVDGAAVPSVLLRGLDGAIAQRLEANSKATIADAPVGRCLGAQSINILLGRAQNHLIARGYVTTRVLAAPQDLKTGLLTLRIIPGRIGAIQAAAVANLKPAPDTALDVPVRFKTALAASSGALLNLRDIEQGLENLKRVPTADANIQIAPSVQEGQATLGQSDLLVSYQQQRPARLSLSVDDSGTDSTGKYMGTATLSVDNPFRLNDLFYASHTRALGGGEPGAPGRRGNESYAVHYSVPFGYWLLAANYNKSRYHQTVAGASQNYIYSGDSQNAEVSLGRVLYRDAQRKTTFTVKGWVRGSRNYIEDVEIEVQRRRMAGWATQLNHREYLGAASLDITLGYKRGTGAFNALRAAEELFNEGTSRFALFTADASLNIPFKLGQQTLRWNTQWRWQRNLTRLTMQDQFSIGGRYTVRGFDGQSTLAAERGWLLRNELGVALGQSGQELYAGMDYGQVGGPSSEYLLGKRLAGAVLGLRGNGWGWAKGLNYDVFAGTPLYKPQGFKTANVAAGFYVNGSF